MAQEQTPKIAQDRSPRFPSENLEQSIDYVTKLFAGLGRSAAPAEALAKAIGYQSLNGASRTALASLSYYGLTIREGNNHRVSDLAVRIIRPISETDKAAAVRQASLEPMLFGQIQQDHPDATEDLLATLLLHKGFTEDGSKRAAKIFKDNLAFLGRFAHVPSKETPPSQNQLKPAPTADLMRIFDKVDPPKPPVISNITSSELPVPIGDNLVAKVPFPMSEEDFELFIDTLKLWKRKLVRKPEPAATTEPKPVEAT